MRLFPGNPGTRSTVKRRVQSILGMKRVVEVSGQLVVLSEYLKCAVAYRSDISNYSV